MRVEFGLRFGRCFVMCASHLAKSMLYLEEYSLHIALDWQVNHSGALLVVLVTWVAMEMELSLCQVSHTKNDAVPPGEIKLNGREVSMKEANQMYTRSWNLVAMNILREI